MELSPLHRLWPRDVERLHRVLAGDPVTEAAILQFIEARWGARNLFYLPPSVADEVLGRPADFIRAAKHFCEPELPF